MSTPNNLLRDLLHVEFGLPTLGLGANSFKGTTVIMTCDGIVRSTAGMARWINQNHTAVSINWSSVGVLIRPPQTDATPYRVKANVYTSVITLDKYIVVGKAPASPGPSNTITDVVAFPFSGSSFDDVVLVPETGDLPVAIGVAFGATASALVEGNISVQNMAMPAPQFSTSMS